MDIFNLYFTIITKELEIRENKTHLSSTNGKDDPIDREMIKHSKHPRVQKIMEALTPSSFIFLLLRKYTIIIVLHHPQCCFFVSSKP